MYRSHDSNRPRNDEIDGRATGTSILVDFPRSLMERETEGGRSLLPFWTGSVHVCPSLVYLTPSLIIQGPKDTVLLETLS